MIKELLTLNMIKSKYCNLESRLNNLEINIKYFTNDCLPVN